MYADGTGLYLCSVSLAQLNETINTGLENPEHWLKGNKFSLNVANTISMNIVSNQKHYKSEGRTASRCKFWIVYLP